MWKRFQNICLVAISLVFSMVRGNGRQQGTYKRFVICHPTTNLGDMVCITPLFRAIKEHDPSSWLTVIGSPLNRSLVAHHPDVDEYIDTSTPLWRLIRSLTAGRFDAGILINPDPRLLSTLFLGGVKAISCLRLASAYEEKESRPYKMLAERMHTVEYHPGAYVPDQYLKLLLPYGIHRQTGEKELRFSPEAQAAIVEKFKGSGIEPDEKIVAIAPGAGSDIKRWPPERFAAVANELYARLKTPILIVGGPKDEDAVTAMLQYLEPRVPKWFAGPQSMDELKATLACARLVIGNDSGAIHIGEAVGAQTLTIAGITDVGEHMEEDERHRIVKGSDTGALYQAYIGDETKIDPQYARARMESVSVEDVLSTAIELLG